MSEWWTSRRFSLANPRDEGSTDLPRLLRRIANEIEAREIAPMDILDLTISQEITEDGPWWTATSTGNPTMTNRLRPKTPRPADSYETSLSLNTGNLRLNRSSLVMCRVRIRFGRSERLSDRGVDDGVPAAACGFCAGLDRLGAAA